MLFPEQIKPEVCGRLRLVRDKLDQATFAGLLNVSPSYISMIEKGKRLPGTTLTELTSIKFNVNLDWLLTGEGEMYNEGGRIVPLRRDGKGKTHKQGVAPREEVPDDFVFIPQVRGEISAGAGSVPDDVIELKIAFAKDWLKRRGDPKNLSLIRIRGDSMEPTLRSGDLVLVDHNRNYLDPQGGIYAVAMDDLIMIKRVQVLYPTDRVSIISDNPQYESIEIKAAEVRINGKIIWFGREIER